MVARVLIIGGYGNFGSYIARSLAPDPTIRLLIGGRASAKAQAFAAGLDGTNPAEGHAIDIDGDLAAAFDRISPDIVIHASGPFQRRTVGWRAPVLHGAATIWTWRMLATSSSRLTTSTPRHASAGCSW